MPYIGRPQSSGAFAKLDDVSSQFNNSKTVFNLTIGNQAFFPGNPYTLLVSLGGVIQEPIASFTILENQINPDRLIIFATHNRFFANKSDCLLEIVNGNIKTING